MLLIPRTALLGLLLIPVIVLSDSMALLGPLFSAGVVDIHLSDVLLALVTVRSVGQALLRRNYPTRVIGLGPVIMLLAILLVSTITAYPRFSEATFRLEIVSLARLAVQLSTLFLVVSTLHSTQDIKKFDRMLHLLGRIITFSVLLAFLLSRIGITFGEILTGTGIDRYFGPFGDQVGFLLLFFIFRNVLARNWVWLITDSVAFLLTGTRGALVALIVGAVVLGLRGSHSRTNRRQRAFATTGGLAIVIAVLVFYDVGGILTRITGPSLATGLEQRKQAVAVGVRMFTDHPLLGVGYSGYRFFVGDYGGPTFNPSVANPAFANATNTYVQVAVDGGLPALTAFLVLLVRALQVFSRTSRLEIAATSSQAAHAWLVALAIGNQTAAWLLPNSLIGHLVWLLLGLALAVDRLSNRTRLSRNASLHKAPPDHTLVSVS